LAGKLLEYPRKLRGRRYLKSLLSSERSQWSGLNVRKRPNRDWRIRHHQSSSRIFHSVSTSERKIPSSGRSEWNRPNVLKRPNRDWRIRHHQSSSRIFRSEVDTECS